MDENIRVLGIFNSHYSSAGYPDLPGVKGDAELWTKFCEIAGWDGDMAVNPTLSEFMNADLTEYDLVIYSGHGVQYHKGSRLCEGLAFVENGRLAVFWDVDVARVKGATETLWFIDSCHSGGLADRHESVGFSVTRSACRLGQVRSLGPVTALDVEVPPDTRALVPALNVVSTARKHELATEVIVGRSHYGLGTYCLHQLLKDPSVVIDAELLKELMVGYGGRRASQPCGTGFDDFNKLVAASADR